MKSRLYYKQKYHLLLGEKEIDKAICSLYQLAEILVDDYVKRKASTSQNASCVIISKSLTKEPSP